MAAPTLLQLRDRLGRELVQQPDHGLLHSALRVIARGVERRDELSPAKRLAVARAVALAIDHSTQSYKVEGSAEPLLSDLLDPSRHPELGRRAPPRAEAAELGDLGRMLTLAGEAVRSGSPDAPVQVGEALSRVYDVIGEPRRRGSGAAGAVMGIAGLLLGARLLGGRRGRR